MKWIFCLQININESFLQIDTMISDGDGQTFTKFRKYQVCNVLIIIQKRSER